MRIESGTTSERRNRGLLFVLMCLAFAGWFAYDGFYAYPKKNVEWARQAMPEKPAELKADPRVRRIAIEELARQAKGGLTIDEIKARLGEPALVYRDDYWFVGPAAYLRVTAPGGRDARLDAQYPPDRSESHIQGQKWMAAALLGIGLLSLISLLRAMAAKAVLDDQGLHYKGRHIPWEAMTGLKTDDYARKGWVDLVYTADGATRQLRLDSYLLRHFHPIVQEICTRKGFPCLPVPEEETADPGGEPA